MNVGLKCTFGQCYKYMNDIKIHKNACIDSFFLTRLVQLPINPKNALESCTVLR